MGWGLQRDPAHRPPSCKKLLGHSFFKLFKTKAPETKDDGTASDEKEEQEKAKDEAAVEEKEGVEETKGGGVAQSTQFSVADVPAGLHVPTFHIAAALGDLEAIEAALTDAAETAAAEVLPRM